MRCLLDDIPRFRVKELPGNSAYHFRIFGWIKLVVGDKEWLGRHNGISVEIGQETRQLRHAVQGRGD